LLTVVVCIGWAGP